MLRLVSGTVLLGLLGMVLATFAYAAWCINLHVTEKVMRDAAFLPAIMGAAAGVLLSTYLFKTED